MTSSTPAPAIEVDKEAADAQSTFDSETTSLSSSILNHTYENGRRYHSYKAGKYFVPNDEAEQDRVDIYHHMALIKLDGELNITPLKSDFSGRVLDLGTGTGTWAIDMGDKYPNAEIIGIDLSPPQTSWVPSNVNFEVDDIEEPWTFRQPFDFIHARWLAGAIRDWPKLMKQTFDNVKPGGYAEFKDWDVRPHAPDGSLNLPDNAVKRWHDIVCGAFEEHGGVTSPGIDMKKRFEDAGFVNVQERVYNVPIGAWAKDPKLKELGKFYGVALGEGVESMSLHVLTHYLKWDVDEVKALANQFREDIKTTPAYHKYHVVSGQKPTE
ncbi:S-adenosyl-L-methionine-dependent methyltransferase [Lineolata rhizophorae]|uniref:S-adenosyl-L-methionine-dependent methyltransferase n=1 Tax=Lineolata rhizophorae TaxID=578093 RepID=A0A6A6P278_9PEZI|nr:S-adenosyl-L-methionine-dependent methyltransferase [Lineolata rhizophorae]